MDHDSTLSDFGEDTTMVDAELAQIEENAIYVEMEQEQVLPDNRRMKNNCALLTNIILQIITTKLLQHSQAAFVAVTNVVHLLQGLQMTRIRLQAHSVYRFNRASAFQDQGLLNSYNEKEFKRRVRVKKSTFLYICSLLAPVMQKSKRAGGIALETRIALSLNRLGTGNYLLGCADLFGVSEALACIVVREFCNAVLKVIWPLVVTTYSSAAFPRLARSFEEKHGIPYIMGAIDGSHIPIIAPSGDPGPFYNRKGFYSVLLQGIVDTKTVFWDWDFGWVGSLHDYTLFVNSRIGQEVISRKYLPYKLIGDAAYPHRTCMYVPFKGTKETLEPAKAHWNFIQSSTRMCVERAFGVLKGRWRILLRRCEMKLNNLASIVGACICLHNLCIMQKDFAGDGLLEESRKWLLESNIQGFGDLQNAGTMAILDYSKAEVARATIDVQELIRQATLFTASEENFDNPNQSDTSNVSALKAGVTMHTQLATNLYNRHLRASVPLTDGFFEDSESDENE